MFLLLHILAHNVVLCMPFKWKATIVFFGSFVPFNHLNFSLSNYQVSGNVLFPSSVRVNEVFSH
jgi:hypothetical protein